MTTDMAEIARDSAWISAAALALHRAAERQFDITRLDDMMEADWVFRLRRDVERILNTAGVDSPDDHSEKE